MPRIALLALGLVLVATAALAVQRKGSGTLARVATVARAGRLAEIAKDASPPKPGGSRVRVEQLRVAPTTDRRATRR